MDKIYLFLFYSFKFFVTYCPKKILYLLMNFLSFFIFTIDKKHKKIAHINLDLAYEARLTDEKKILIIKKCYKNLIYTLIDFVRNQNITKERLLRKVSFENEYIIKDAIKKHKKIIILTGHYGNWELLGLAISSKFIPMTTVGRNLDSEVMNAILEKNRKQHNMDVISKKGAMKGMIKALKNNKAIGILVDQNTKEDEGVLVDFFDKKVRHTPSAAILAKKFDCIIIPTFITTNDYENFIIKFYEPIVISHSDNKNNDILNCVQKQANITQKVIEDKPEEWFWLHKRWKNQYEYMYK